jgi:hypothetical protein
VVTIVAVVALEVTVRVALRRHRPALTPIDTCLASKIDETQLSLERPTKVHFRWQYRCMTVGLISWQRVLLESLAVQEIVSVRAAARSHLRREPVLAEWWRVQLAARRLARFGKARTVYLAQCELCGRLSSAQTDCLGCRRSDFKRVLILTRLSSNGTVIKVVLPPPRRPTSLSFSAA